MGVESWNSSLWWNWLFWEAYLVLIIFWWNVFQSRIQLKWYKYFKLMFISRVYMHDFIFCQWQNLDSCFIPLVNLVASLGVFYFLAHQDEIRGSLCYNPGLSVRTWLKFLVPVLHVSKLLLVLPSSNLHGWCSWFELLLIEMNWLQWVDFYGINDSKYKKKNNRQKTVYFDRSKWLIVWNELWLTDKQF